MKYLSLLLLVSPLTYAGFGKPSLLARLNFDGAWNAPDNMWCFSSEPAIHEGAVHLGCFDDKGHLMARWKEGKFDIIARAESEQLFSTPVSSFGKINWYEFNEWTAVRTYEADPDVSSRDIRKLGPYSDASDSFLPYTKDAYFFRLKNESPELYIWKNDEVLPFFSPKAAFIYTPQIGSKGEIAVKTRDTSYDETSPDKIWLFDNGWKVVLSDRDADKTSPWLSLRHQLSVEGKTVLVIAKDQKGEALLLVSPEKTEVIARAGTDLKSFDFFSPKMRSGTIVFRGEDFEGRKVTYVKDDEGLRRLLTQGDIVHTDVGAAKVHYKDRDAIFYGAPGIDESGNVYLQATLTDSDHPNTLLGIGIIKFNKE